MEPKVCSEVRDQRLNLRNDLSRMSVLRSASLVAESLLGVDAIRRPTILRCKITSRTVSELFEYIYGFLNYEDWWSVEQPNTTHLKP